MIVAFANQKGGVGKTTTAVNLAGYLAASGRRILLVDLDPQGNAATCLGIPKTRIDLTSGDVLFGTCVIGEAVMPAGRPGLDILPATPDLAGVAVRLGGLPRREYRLREALSQIEQNFE